MTSDAVQAEFPEQKTSGLRRASSSRPRETRTSVTLELQIRRCPPDSRWCKSVVVCHCVDDWTVFESVGRWLDLSVRHSDSLLIPDLLGCVCVTK